MTGLSIFDIPTSLTQSGRTSQSTTSFAAGKLANASTTPFPLQTGDITVREELTADELDTIRKHAPWVRTLTIDYPEDGPDATYDLEGTILPVLPELTRLTRIDITLDDEIFNPELLVGILSALPDSVRILEVDYEYYFKDWEQSQVEEPVLTWKPNKLERICLRGAYTSASEGLYPIPLIKASQNYRRSGSPPSATIMSIPS